MKGGQFTTRSWLSDWMAPFNCHRPQGGPHLHNWHLHGRFAAYKAEPCQEAALCLLPYLTTVFYLYSFLFSITFWLYLGCQQPLFLEGIYSCLTNLVNSTSPLFCLYFSVWTQSGEVSCCVKAPPLCQFERQIKGLQPKRLQLPHLICDIFDFKKVHFVLFCSVFLIMN